MKTFDKKWEEVHKSRAWGQYPSEDVIRFIARNYYQKNRADIKILDLGCGQGANTWYLAREGFDVYALDGSSSAVESAKKYLKSNNLNAKIVVSDASNTMYKDDFFDCVIDSAVIYANTSNGIKAILKEVNRVLKPQGKIISTGLFNKQTTGYGTGEFIEKNTYRNLETGSLEGLGVVHFFDKEEIVKTWNEVGYTNIKIDNLLRSDYGGKFDVGYYILEATKK